MSAINQHQLDGKTVESVETMKPSAEDDHRVQLGQYGYGFIIHFTDGSWLEVEEEGGAGRIQVNLQGGRAKP